MITDSTSRLPQIGLVVFLVAAMSYAPDRSQAQSKSGGKRELVVDVRTPFEFKQGHFPGAINIPLDQVDKRLSEFGDADQPIVVYCRSGRRSGLAKRILERAGYNNVINGGGLNAMMRQKRKGAS